MAQSQPISPSPSAHEHLALHRVFAYSAVVAVLIIIAGAIYLSQHKKVVNTAQPVDTGVSTTPLWFNDIIGPVVSSAGDDKIIEVSFTVRRDNGTEQQKSYKVAVTDQTVIVKNQNSAEQTTEAPATMSDITAGAIIQVFGGADQNLYDLNQFTATKIIILQTK